MKVTLPALTGLRFIAAASIAHAHFTNGNGYTVFGKPLEFAAVGMPLFFTLSGFIIHYVYADVFASGWRRAVPEFAVARFSRLYPLFLVLLVVFALGPWSSETGSMQTMARKLWFNPEIAVSYLTLTGSWWYWTIDDVMMGDGRYGWSWSISTEVFFYVIYAVALYRISLVADLRKCAVALVSVIGIASLLEAILFFIFYGARQGNAFTRWLFYYSPYFQIVGFIAGCLVCQIYLIAKRSGRTGLEKSSAWLGAAGCAWIFASLAFLTYHRYAGGGGLAGFVNFLQYNVLMVPGCCLLILSLALGGTGLGKLLSRPLPEYLGEISYSIYLGHPFIFVILYFSLDPENAFAKAAVFTAVLLATSSALYFFIERPSKRAIRAGFSRVGFIWKAAGKTPDERIAKPIKLTPRAAP